MAAHEIVIDQWSPLSHKAPIGQATDAPALDLAPSWVPRDQRRRLAAYLVRAAYANNVARLMLPTSVEQAERDQHREYGDVPTFLDRVADAMLGTGWQIVVDGAEGDFTDGPELPERPAEAADDADELVKRIADGRIAAWTAQATGIVEDWLDRLAAQPAAQTRQNELREWADAASLAATLHEGEHTAVSLADAVYVLWPQVGDWPLVEVYDPATYFPELDDLDRGAYPDVVHLAWEFEVRDGTNTERFLRRLTWEIVDLTLEHMVMDRSGPAWKGPDGAPLPAGQQPELHEGDAINANGIIERTLPWHEEGDDRATTTCVFSNGVWKLDAVEAGKVKALDLSAAQWDAYRQDLGVDFIPVVHLPNTPAGARHFGDATLDKVAQLLDDLAATDTRIMGGSQYLGAPTVGASGVNVADGVMAPGKIIGLGKDGRLDPLDLSAGIAELFNLDDRLMDRFLQNVSAPGELLGRVDESTTSGLHLLLKFTPWSQLVGSMRLPRAAKYRIFLRMVQRLAQVQGVLPPGPTPVARIAFGSFLPSDTTATIEQVTKLLAAKAISRPTAVDMLVGAGLPIDDARAEVERITAEDTEAAVQIADATGSEAAAAAHLGIDLAPAGAPPAIDLPPAP